MSNSSKTTISPIMYVLVVKINGVDSYVITERQTKKERHIDDTQGYCTLDTIAKKLVPAAASSPSQPQSTAAAHPHIQSSLCTVLVTAFLYILTIH